MNETHSFTPQFPQQPDPLLSQSKEQEQSPVAYSDDHTPKISRQAKEILPKEIRDVQAASSFKSSAEPLSELDPLEQNIDRTAKQILLPESALFDNELDEELAREIALLEAQEEQDLDNLYEKIHQTEETGAKIQELSQNILPSQEWQHELSLENVIQSEHLFAESETRLARTQEEAISSRENKAITLTQVEASTAAIKASGVQALLIGEEMVSIDDLGQMTPAQQELFREMHRKQELVEVHQGSKPGSVILKLSENCRDKYQLNMRIRGSDNVWKTIEAIQLLSEEELSEKLRHWDVIFTFLLQQSLMHHETNKEKPEHTEQPTHTQTHIKIEHHVVKAHKSKKRARLGNEKVNKTLIKIEGFTAPAMKKLMKSFREKTEKAELKEKEAIKEDNEKRVITRMELKKEIRAKENSAKEITETVIGEEEGVIEP